MSTLGRAANFSRAAGLVHPDWRWQYYLVLLIFYIIVTFISEKVFAAVTRRVRRGMRPFTRFITQFYDRQFLEIFMNPRDTLGLIDAVTFVLAGGAFHRIPPKMRFLIGLFWTIVRINRRIRRAQGRAESRL